MVSCWWLRPLNSSSEFSTSVAAATVTSAMAVESVSGPDLAEDEALVDYLFGNEDENGPTLEEIVEIGRDGLGSDDDIPQGRFSRLDAERTVKP